VLEQVAGGRRSILGKDEMLGPDMVDSSTMGKGEQDATLRLEKGTKKGGHDHTFEAGGKINLQAFFTPPRLPRGGGERRADRTRKGRDALYLTGKRAKKAP